jgi:hypothetical protein
MANEFIARRGLKVLENGLQITGSSQFSANITASGNITASEFYGDGANITNVGFNNISNKPTLVSASIQIDHDQTTNFVANEHTDHSAVNITAGGGLNGGGDITTTRTLSVNSGSMLPYYSSSIFSTISGDILINSAGVATIQADAIVLGTDTTGDYVSTITAGDGISTTGATSGETIAHTISLNTSSAHFIDGVNQTITAGGTVTSSGQIDVRDTIGIETIATTGSNTFTGIQTISNTTNSTAFTNGALVVAGGVGIGKDVNISGSLNVTGLLTVVSMSTQYVTSSQLVVGTSRVILNDDDLVRFAGLSVVDSGSTAATGSLLWDSLKNHWIYEREDGGPYRSAILISGPKNYGSLGDEEELIVGRVPVATGGDHIDTNLASSSIYIDFGTRETHIEAGLNVTGSVTASLGFSGDGSNLTGIVTNFNLSGSAGGNGTISLKTQSLIVSGTNGVTATVNNQTLTISGSNATTSSRGVASFNTNNFTVTDGAVSAKVAVVNGVNVELGSSVNISLAEITSASATTPDQLLLNGGAVIHGILYTSGSATIPSPTNSVISNLPTGSHDASHYDYVLKSNSNLRTGTVMAIWEAGTNNIVYTDTSTNDIGNTLGADFAVDLLNGNVRLKLTADAETWTVKTSVRMI